jgi:hypothetical protein
MTAVVEERSTDGLTRTFESCSTDEDCDGVRTSDEPNDVAAGESNKCKGPAIWVVRGDGGMIGSARFGLWRHWRVVGLEGLVIGLGFGRLALLEELLAEG